MYGAARPRSGGCSPRARRNRRRSPSLRGSPAVFRSTGRAGSCDGPIPAVPRWSSALPDGHPSACVGPVRPRWHLSTAIGRKAFRVGMPRQMKTSQVQRGPSPMVADRGVCARNSGSGTPGLLPPNAVSSYRGAKRGSRSTAFARSSSSRRCFVAMPPGAEKPRNALPLARTRWHGMMIGTGLRPIA